MNPYSYARRRFLRTAGFAAAWSAAYTLLPGCAAAHLIAPESRNKPNIIFIMTDDQADWAFGVAPNPDAYTPNLDRLRSQGARLTNCFVTTPVCSPSRASLLTSRYSTEVGITDFIKSRKVGLDPAFAAWPRFLADAGYATGLIGKWHVGDKDEYHPTLYGYQEFTGFRWGGKVSRDPEIEVGGEVRRLEGYTPDILTDYAVDFIRRKKDGPFMLSLHYWAPHASTVSRAPDRGHTWLPLSDADYGRFENMEPNIPDPDYPKLDVPLVERMMREYLGSVASVDRNLGRILDLLDELKLTDDTVVIFTSDNGYNVGHNAVEGKGNASWTLTNNREERPNLYDNSLRVPTIIRWPNVVEPGRTVEQTITFLDWFPTLLAIGGLGVPKGEIIHGRNFLPLLGGKAIKWDNDLFAQYTMRGGGVMRAYRTPQWKLVRDFENFIKDELYDLVNDPAERTNVIDSPEPRIQSVRRSLNQKLLDKMRSINDPALPAT